MAERTGEIIKVVETDDSITLADRTDNSLVSANSSATEEIATEPEEIREQIEDTRREMGETINAIQEKLSFANISEQVTEQVSDQISGAVESIKTAVSDVSDATIGKAGKVMKNLSRQFKNSDVTKKLGENPIPLAVAGFAVGLLIFGVGRKKKKVAKYRYKETFAHSDHDQKEAATLSDKASKIYEGVGDSAGSAYESVSGAAGKTYEKLGDLGGQLRNQYKEKFGGNPFADGVLALAAGAAIGLLIPSTEYENQLMGETRENLLGQAQEAARGTIEKVQQAVGQAKDTIVEEVKSQTAQKQ